MRIAPNFDVSELICKCGCGRFIYNAPALRCLQRLRDYAGVSLTVVSGTRCEAHNAAVGGAPASFHMKGMAFDVKYGNLTGHELREAALLAGFTVARQYPTFLHVDIGPNRNW